MEMTLPLEQRQSSRSWESTRNKPGNRRFLSCYSYLLTRYPQQRESFCYLPQHQPLHPRHIIALLIPNYIAYYFHRGTTKGSHTDGICSLSLSSGTLSLHRSPGGETVTDDLSIYGLCGWDAGTAKQRRDAPSQPDSSPLLAGEMLYKPPGAV